MVAKLSDIVPVSSNNFNKVLEKEAEVEVMRLREARESGIEAGYCTARRVNTICNQVSKNPTRYKSKMNLWQLV